MNDLPSTKAMSFVKGMAKSRSENEAGKKAKIELKKSLEEVKKKAAEPGVKKSLRDELENLEENVIKVASMEKQLLNKEDRDIKDLKFQIRDLKTKLSLTGAEGLKPSLDRIGFLLSELTSRFETFTKIKTEREQRMQELEEKIKKNMDKNFAELMQMEKTLAELEKKYEEIRKSEKSEDQRLRLIAEKISELRKKLIEKRSGIVEKKKTEMSKPAPPEKIRKKPGLTKKPIPPPKMITPPPQPVKHKMLFPPPSPGVPKKEPEFKMPPEPKPEKKGIIGWIKGLFGR